MAARIETTQGSSSELTIAGTEVVVTHEVVPIDTLRLDPDNPRIRFQINHGTRKKPRNTEELLAIVRAQPGYEELQKQIRKQGGIHDPLIVRHDGMIVEGNTRFAVVSFLAKPDRSVERWTMVPVTRLERSVPESTVQLLMADYHIAGKNTWRPAAQADQIYRLIEECKVSPEEVADATRMTVKKVLKYVQTYKFLTDEVTPEAETGNKIDKQAILEKKFSHALELMTRKELSAIREDPEARKKVAKLIATDKIQGREMRDLPVLMRNARANETLEKEGFKAATDVLNKADPTVHSKILKSIQHLTDMLTSMSQPEIELIKKHAKAKTILVDLSDAVQDLVSITKAREGKRSAR